MRTEAVKQKETELRRVASCSTRRGGDVHPWWPALHPLVFFRARSLSLSLFLFLFARIYYCTLQDYPKSCAILSFVYSLNLSLSSLSFPFPSRLCTLSLVSGSPLGTRTKGVHLSIALQKFARTQSTSLSPTPKTKRGTKRLFP